MGDIQDRIVKDSEKKKVFTTQDFLNYYKSVDEARRSFDQLTAQGYFQKGIVRGTGQIVYTSNSYKQTTLKDPRIIDDLHPSFFTCPSTKEFTTTETCETTGLNAGCMYLKHCPAYHNKKQEEKKDGLSM